MNDPVKLAMATAREIRKDAPLTGGARFIRGFTRIGTVIALLIALVGIAVTGFETLSSYNGASTRHNSAVCLAHLAHSGYTFEKRYDGALDYSKTRCEFWWEVEYLSLTSVIALADEPAPTFVSTGAPSILGWGLFITGFCAVVVYLACWVLGWVFAGFTRDA